MAQILYHIAGCHGGHRVHKRNNNSEWLKFFTILLVATGGHYGHRVPWLSKKVMWAQNRLIPSRVEETTLTSTVARLSEARDKERRSRHLKEFHLKTNKFQMRNSKECKESSALRSQSTQGKSPSTEATTDPKDHQTNATNPRIPHCMDWHLTWQSSQWLVASAR